MLSKHDFILPEEFVKSEKLESPFVKWKHIEELGKFQKDHHNKIQPGINEKTFDLGPFAKMHVGPAVNALSRPTGAALEIMVEHHDYPEEYKTTAFFANMMGRWFDLMSSRNPGHCFSNGEKGKYVENIQFLIDFMRMFDNLKFVKHLGDNEQYIQMNVRLTTMSMITHTEYYLNVRGLKFLLGGRFGSDCVENFISQVRRRMTTPTTLNFKYAFRALLIVNHMKPSKSSSYFEDDHTSKWFTELEHIRNLKMSFEDDDEDRNVFEVLIGDRVTKDFSEENALRYLIGYLFKKTICSESKCQVCLDAFVKEHCDATETEILVFKRCYTPDALVMVTEYAYKIFSMVESTFMANLAKMENEKFMDALVEKVVITTKNLFQADLPTCHWTLLIKRFFKIRVYFWARKLTVDAKSSPDFEEAKKSAGHASKTTAGHQLS